MDSGDEKDELEEDLDKLVMLKQGYQQKIEKLTKELENNKSRS